MSSVHVRVSLVAFLWLGLACGIPGLAGATVTERVLHTFSGGRDGGIPVGGLLRDSAGNLFGVAQAGGDTSKCRSQGCGVAFELSPSSNGTWAYKVIYTFCSQPYCIDGAGPRGTLISDSQGRLYGTTTDGGNPQMCSFIGCGVVFRLTPSSSGWNYEVLFAFHEAFDGGRPFDMALTLDGAGNLYGTAANGGTFGGSCAFGGGCGVVFELSPSPVGTTWTEKVLHIFTGGADGALPEGGVIFDATGGAYLNVDISILVHIYMSHDQGGIPAIPSS